MPVNERLQDELWSPEHDWILQFDRLLSPKKEKKHDIVTSELTLNGNESGEVKLRASLTPLL